MLKKIVRKLFAVMLGVIILSSNFMVVEAKAVNLEQSIIKTSETMNEVNNSDESSEFEEKIMMYDAKTKTTTEVDIDKISSLLRKANINIAEPATTNINAIEKNTEIMPLADSNGISVVTNSKVFPYIATCKTTSDNVNGTGFLVGPNLLLTAAHCVMNTGPDSVYANWKCQPAYNGTAVTINGVTHSTGWSQIYYSNAWVNFKWADYDWCLCVLENDLGNDIGYYFGAQAYGTNSELNNVSVKAIGYAGENGYNGAFQHYSTGITSNTHARYFECSAYTINGMSGGPIIRTSDNYAVGIVRGAYEDALDTTYGVRITQSIVDLINDLR